MITVGQLLENYKKGNIILVDSTTDTEAGVIPAESPVIKLIEEKEVIDWQACKTSAAVPRIKVFCKLS